jgi:ADP-heptose:LPS heptosyltransferase
MASDYAAPVLENNSAVKNIINIDNNLLKTNENYRENLRLKLVGKKYTVAVVLYPEKNISRLIYQAGIPTRVGTIRRFHSIYFNRYLFHSRKVGRKHESEYNLDFLVFFKDGDMVNKPHIYLTEIEINKAREMLERAGISDRFVVIHPGSGGSAVSWPVRKFLELYNVLDKKGTFSVITGSGDEQKLIAELAEKHNIRINSIAGQTSLRVLGAVMSLADIAISNSTGPLHLAAAVGTRVIGLYPAIKVMSPKRWGPVGQEHRVFQPEENADMESISVAEVVSEVDSMLMKNKEKK